MKKTFIPFLVLLIILLNSCEKDDFCTLNPVTPNLVLRFYDKDNVDDFKSVVGFSVTVKDATESLTTSDTDSIAIPLNTNAQETVYILTRNQSNSTTTSTSEEATFTIKYDTENEYVSRSCGYRVIFNNVSFEEIGWIDRLSTNEVEFIKTQTNAHVNIFH